MSIVEFDGPPPWSLDASETGKRKMPVDSGGGVNSGDLTEKIGDCEQCTELPP